MKKNHLILSLLAVCMATMLVSCSEKKDEYAVRKYLAVQKEKDDCWSIIDADGKVVVDGEYDAECQVSNITDKGTYWVRTGDKFQLYSVKSPQKAISDEEYDAVTTFYNGRACVSRSGQQIQVIDEDGDVVATLPKEVKYAGAFGGGMAPVMNKDSKVGFIDKSGKIVIEMQYEWFTPFSDGIAFVRKKEDGDFEAINTKGETQFKISAKKYDSTGCGMTFSEGLVAVETTGDKPKSEYLDKEGETAFKLKRYCRYSQPFHDGYAVINDISEGDVYGVIDKKGEYVIRMGKYKAIYNIGNGKFIASKKKSDSKYGIIDKEEKVLLDFDYDNMCFYTLGDNYIVQEDDSWQLVDKKGKVVGDSEFHAISSFSSPGVVFVDKDAIVNDIAANIDNTGYKPLDGMTAVGQIAEKFSLDMDEMSDYAYSFSLPEFKADLYSVNVTAGFSARVVEKITHTEYDTYGWYSFPREVVDGHKWSDSAYLTQVILSLHTSSDIDDEDLRDMLVKKLKSKGFEPVEGEDDMLAGSNCRVLFAVDGRLDVKIMMIYKE